MVRKIRNKEKMTTDEKKFYYIVRRIRATLYEVDELRKDDRIQENICYGEDTHILNNFLDKFKELDNLLIKKYGDLKLSDNDKKTASLYLNELDYDTAKEIIERFKLTEKEFEQKDLDLIKMFNLLHRFFSFNLKFFCRIYSFLIRFWLRN